MSNNSSLKIVVAETSVIIRSGLTAVLKRIPNLNIHPIEVSSPETLHNYIRLHTPDVVIVDPTFGGWFDLQAFKAENHHPGTKYVALVCSVIDANALKEYDESIAICDDLPAVTAIINRLLQTRRRKQGHRTGNAQPARKGDYHLRGEGHDQQDHCRQTVPLHPHRHHPPAQHRPQTPDTFPGRPHHLRHREQAGGTARHQRYTLNKGALKCTIQNCTQNHRRHRELILSTLKSSVPSVFHSLWAHLPVLKHPNSFLSGTE